MEHIEYLSLAVQLTIIGERKNILQLELDEARADRNDMFDQYSTQNTKKEYLSFKVMKTKEELRYYIQSKEILEISLAQLLAKKIIHPEEDPDLYIFDEIEIQNKENDIVQVEKDIENINKQLIDDEQKLQDFLLDDDIIKKHRQTCRKYQIIYKDYNDIVKEELQVSKQLLLFYRKSKT